MNYSSSPAIGLKRQSIFSAVVKIVLCSFLIALCAQIRIPLFFTPVPLTLQTLAVMAVGCMLGSRQGAMCVVLYVLEAMVGLPVLPGGRSEMMVLFSALGGYYVGFILLAFIAGWLAERKTKLPTILIVGGLLAACAVQLLMGAVWLGGFIGFSQGLFLGIVPFIPGEVLKVVAILAVLLSKRS